MCIRDRARLDAALATSQSELQLIKDKAVTTLGEEAASVFDAHMMVLADPDMTAQIKAVINDKKVNAESALKEVTDMFIGIFEGMTDNAYMQAVSYTHLILRLIEYEAIFFLQVSQSDHFQYNGKVF